MSLFSLCNAPGKIDFYSQQMSHSLSVQNVTCKREISRVAEVVGVWLKEAQLIYKLSQGSSVSNEKCHIVKTSVQQIKAVYCHLSQKNLEDFHIYIAENRISKVIEGIAIAAFSGNDFIVENLITNPKNLIIFGTEKNAIRGAGTILIEQIAHDAKMRDKKARICLETLVASRPFYKKLGFIQKKDEDDENWLELPEEKVVQFSTHVLQRQQKLMQM